jgi:mannose-6-phosphate isomerase-like protein (cupin superfamily)
MVVKGTSVEPTSFEGLRVFDYTAGSNASSSLAVIEVPPGARHPEAWSNRSDKYYYVTSGRVRFRLEEAEYELVSGDFCLVRRGAHFWYENETQELATMLLVHTPSFELESEVFAE